jgi:hypothetical protein
VSGVRRVSACSRRSPTDISPTCLCRRRVPTAAEPLGDLVLPDPVPRIGAPRVPRCFGTRLVVARHQTHAPSRARADSFTLCAVPDIGGVAPNGRFEPIVEFMFADFMWVCQRPPVQPGRQGVAHARGRRRCPTRAPRQGVRLESVTAPSTRWIPPECSPLRRVVYRRAVYADRYLGLMNSAPAIAKAGEVTAQLAEFLQA